MERIKKAALFSAAAVFLLGLCACGKASIQINDNGTVTELEVSMPRTVEQILGDAEISLNEGDEVTPSLDTKLSEAQEIAISRKHTVKLSADGETREVTMAGGTVGSLLEQEGITLGEKQHVNYGLEEYLTDGMEVKISCSYGITVQCDGKTHTQETEAGTVRDALAELGITLGKDDRVTPEASEAVTEGMEIVVSRVTVDTVVETEEIGYETAYEDDSSLPKGEERVSREGEKGQKEVSYQVMYVDGTEESRVAANETVTKEPVNKIVRVGTKEDTPPAEAPPAAPERSVVSKKAFYDCSDNSHGYYEITYSDGSVEYEEF